MKLPLLGSPAKKLTGLENEPPHHIYEAVYRVGEIVVPPLYSPRTHSSHVLAPSKCFLSRSARSCSLSSPFASPYDRPAWDDIYTRLPKNIALRWSGQSPADMCD